MEWTYIKYPFELLGTGPVRVRTQHYWVTTTTIVNRVHPFTCKPYISYNIILCSFFFDLAAREHNKQQCVIYHAYGLIRVLLKERARTHDYSCV